MADAKPLNQYRGNCHCGAYVFEIKLPDPIPASECSCSICTRKGYVWIRVTPEYEFKVVKGDKSVLTSYTKNDFFHHKVCPGHAPTSSCQLGADIVFLQFCTNCSVPIMASNDKEGDENMTVLNVSVKDCDL